MTQPGDFRRGAGLIGAAARDSLAGRTLAGRYRIVRQLGEGGMASVYVAQHATLGKYVALKILHPHMARRGDIVARFLREAKAASRIDHMNVIAISDFGTTPEGLVFFAMELLDGHDLFEELTEATRAGGGIGWNRLRRFALQICAALAAAHEQGVIHRDLKPENIYLVAGVGGRERVVLLDFGIAKVSEPRRNGRKLTGAGMLFGTPEYMSPEQAQGKPVDHRADIYAFGCLLFQLVSGTVPFEGDTHLDTLQKHIHDDPPPLGEALAAIGAPRRLERVICRALEKDADRRYQTIRELAEDIRGPAKKGRERAKPARQPARGEAETRAAARPAERAGAAPAHPAPGAQEAPTGALAARAVVIAAVPGDDAAAAGEVAPDASSSPHRRRWPAAAVVGALAVVGAVAFVKLHGVPAWGEFLGAPARAQAPAQQSAAPASKVMAAAGPAHPAARLAAQADAGAPAVAAESAAPDSKPAEGVAPGSTPSAAASAAGTAPSHPARRRASSRRSARHRRVARPSSRRHPHPARAKAARKQIARGSHGSSKAPVAGTASARRRRGSRPAAADHKPAASKGTGNATVADPHIKNPFKK